MSLHIFDLDHTLIRKAASIALLKEGIKQGTIPFIPLIRLPLFMGLYRMGCLGSDVVEKELPFLEGISREKMHELGEVAFEKKIRNNVYPEAKKLLDDLKTAGHELLLATSSFYCSIEVIAGHLGFDKIICSKLEFDENHICTGKTEGKPAFGKYKQEKVYDYLQEKSISLEECSFYSDSSHDLPLLEKVGNPVAVNPDKKLRKRARKAGWKILDFV